MSKIKKTSLLFAIALVFFTPFFVYAVEPYVPIEEIPLVGKPSEVTAYLKGIFQFGVAAIAIVSMVVIMIGGYLYIFSAGGKTEKAKQMITNALLGLGLALTSWIIVYTINPDLVELKGIQDVNINLVNRGNLGNVRTGVGMDISDKCSVLQTKWEPTSAYLGGDTTLSFTVPEGCVEGDTIAGISAVVTIRKDKRLESDPVVEERTFSKTAGDLIQDADHPSILKAKWTIPGPTANCNVCENDILTFSAEMIFVTKDNQTFRSARKDSINNLNILPTRLISVCEISKAKWESGAIFEKNAADNALVNVKALLDVSISAGCNTEFNPPKYALKVKFFMGSVESHRPETFISQDIINLPDSNKRDVISKFYVINSSKFNKYKPGDWFYAETIVVKANDVSKQIFPKRTTVDTQNISERGIYGEIVRTIN